MVRDGLLADDVEGWSCGTKAELWYQSGVAVPKRSCGTRAELWYQSGFKELEKRVRVDLFPPFSSVYMSKCCASRCVSSLHATSS